MCSPTAAVMAGGAVLGGLSAWSDSGNQEQAARKQLDDTAYSNQLSAILNQQRTLNTGIQAHARRVTAGVEASRRHSAGTYQGIQETGRRVVAASASNLAEIEGTTTAETIRQAMVQGEGAGRAEAERIRGAARQQYIGAMFQQSGLYGQDAAGLAQGRMRLESATASYQAASDPWSKGFGVLSGAIGGASTGVGLYNSASKLKIF